MRWLTACGGVRLTAFVLPWRRTGVRASGAEWREPRAWRRESTLSTRAALDSILPRDLQPKTAGRAPAGRATRHVPRPLCRTRPGVSLCPLCRDWHPLFSGVSLCPLWQVRASLPASLTQGGTSLPPSLAPADTIWVQLGPRKMAGAGQTSVPERARKGRGKRKRAHDVVAVGECPVVAEVRASAGDQVPRALTVVNRCRAC